MVIENHTWIYIGWSGNAGFRGGFEIKGDTTLNNKQYKKVYKLNMQYGFWPEPFEILSEFLVAFIREDIDEKKVYGIGFPSFPSLINSEQSCDDFPGEEVLLHDFDLEIGDTIKTCLAIANNGIPNPLIVENIIEEVHFGYSFKTFETNSYYSKLYEGFGFSSGGLFTGANLNITAGGGNALSHYCRAIDSESCLLTSNESIAGSQKLKIYPNPSKGEITVETDMTVSNLKLYNYQGTMIKDFESILFDKQNINLSSLQNGVYFVKIENELGQIRMRKIVIQK